MTVKHGDTIEKIAKRHNMTPEELMEANPEIYDGEQGRKIWNSHNKKEHKKIACKNHVDTILYDDRDRLKIPRTVQIESTPPETPKNDVPPENNDPPNISTGTNDGVSSTPTTGAATPAAGTPEAAPPEPQLLPEHELPVAIEDNEPVSAEVQKRREFWAGRVRVGQFKTAEACQAAIDKYMSGELGDPSIYKIVIDNINERMSKEFSVEKLDSVRNKGNREKAYHARKVNELACMVLHNSKTEAGDTFSNELRNNNGVAEAAADKFGSWFGSDNTREKVLDDLVKEGEDILSLKKTAQTATEKDFAAAFRRTTGREYDSKLAEQFAEEDKKYHSVLSCKSTIEQSEQLEKLTYSTENLERLENAVTEGKKETLFAVEGYGNRSSEDRFQYLQSLISEKKNETKELYSQILDGKDFDTFKAEYQTEQEKFFMMVGADKIKERVYKYCESQEIGAEYVKVGAKILGTIGLSLVTGGVAGIMVGTGLISLGVDAGNEYSKKGHVTDEEWKEFGQTALVDAATAGVAGKAAKLISISQMGKVAKYATFAATDAAIGTGNDYLKTGQVTAEGVAVGLAFGAIGGASALRGRKVRPTSHAESSTPGLPELPVVAKQPPGGNIEISPSKVSPNEPMNAAQQRQIGQNVKSPKGDASVKPKPAEKAMQEPFKSNQQSEAPSKPRISMEDAAKLRKQYSDFVKNDMYNLDANQLKKKIVEIRKLNESLRLLDNKELDTFMKDCQLTSLTQESIQKARQTFSNNRDILKKLDTLEEHWIHNELAEPLKEISARFSHLRKSAGVANEMNNLSQTINNNIRNMKEGEFFTFKAGNTNVNCAKIGGKLKVSTSDIKGFQIQNMDNGTPHFIKGGVDAILRKNARYKVTFSNGKSIEINTPM